MRIEPNSGTNAFKRVESSVPTVKRDTATTNSAVFNGAEALNKALQREIDVREAEVERAIALVGQVKWPPLETIHRIASLLAGHLAF